MKDLRTAEQVISVVAQTVDALNENDIAELMEPLKAIQSALESVTTKLEK